jgi:hypothetical protein
MFHSFELKEQSWLVSQDSSPLRTQESAPNTAKDEARTTGFSHHSTPLALPLAQPRHLKGSECKFFSGIVRKIRGEPILGVES